jgi:molybdopterin-synthase adenylyltransferase
MLVGGLPNRPQLQRSYYVLTVPDSNEIQLQSDGRALRLQPADSSDLLQTLLSLLDGTHTVDEILSLMSKYDRDQVVDSLYRLKESRLLEDASPSQSQLSPQQRSCFDSQLTFLAHFVDAPEAHLATLLQSRVAVLGGGATGSHVLKSLASIGVGSLVGIEWPFGRCDEPIDVHEELRRASGGIHPWCSYEEFTLTDCRPDSIGEAVGESQLLVVALDKPDPGLLESVNAACVGSGQAWIPVGLRAWEGFVGPTVIPNETACFACYSLRTKANLAEFEPFQRYENHLKAGAPRRVFGSLPQFSPIIAGMTAIEVAKILTRFSAPTTFGRVLTFDFLSFIAAFHPVLKLPRCPVCGAPAQHLPMNKPWTN